MPRASFSGTANDGVNTLAVSGFNAKAGDLLALWGIGPSYDQSPAGDAFFQTDGDFAAVDPGAVGTTITVGIYGSTAQYQYPNPDYGMAARLYSFGVDTTPAAVPEPASTALLGAGLLGLGMVRRRRAMRREAAAALLEV